MSVTKGKWTYGNVDGRDCKHEDKEMVLDDLKEQEKGHSCIDRPAVARLDLLSCECGPSSCPVGERLELFMTFALDRQLEDAWWEVKFIVDSVYKRHVVRLGATEKRDYLQGESSMHFQVQGVSTEGITPCTLANTGLLVASLMCPSSIDLNEDIEAKRLPLKSEGKAVRPVDAQHTAEYKRHTAAGKSELLDGRYDEVAAINLVVQVTDAGEGTLVRCIYSPLE